MRRWRIALVVAGVLLGGFGAFRLLTQIPASDLVVLALWLIGAVLIHDGILSPFVVGLGWTISRAVPARARRFVQIALITGALVTVIAIPMIYRRGSQPPSKAILRQNYGGNLAVLLGIIAVLTLMAYAVRVARDRDRTPSATPDRPPEDAGPS